MLEKLKQEVLEANLSLKKEGLVISTWGNVSAIDRESGLVVIKASGVHYDEMGIEHMVVVDLDGKPVESDLNPSSDTLTHVELYKAFPEIGSIIHTHSMFATIWAQAGKDIPNLGTTHSDYFCGSIPCTRQLSEQEINEAYEKNTGKLIIETLKERNIEPLKVPAILCNDHGPFVWGKDSKSAILHAMVLEYVAHMACVQSIVENSNPTEVSKFLMVKHQNRKFGPNAYYGQKKK